MKKLKINLQNAYSGKNLAPKKALFLDAVFHAVQHLKITKALEITVRLVNNEEQKILNRDYRHKDYATNILSFPNDDDFPYQKYVYLGDLVIAVDVVTKEAAEQQKDINHHWKHLVIHGFLHLLGYDHIHDDEAEEMEGLEKEILAKMNIPNPY